MRRSAFDTRPTLRQKLRGSMVRVLEGAAGSAVFYLVLKLVGG